MVAYATKVRRTGIQAVQQAVSQGKLPVGQAAALAKHTPSKQEKLWKAIEKGDAKNVRDAERKATLAEQVKAIKLAPPVVGRFEVLVVDPPWTFNKTREDDPTQRGRTPYPTMTEDQIKAIKLPESDNCILWLWTTNAHLATGEASRVLQAWGYNPKSILTWVKNKMGTGDWLRGQTEHCILATKGRPVVCPPVPSTVLNAAVNEHSEKPDEFYRMVETMCPGSKGELFARRKRDGWNQHGVELGSIPAPVVEKPVAVFGVDERGKYTKVGEEMPPVPMVPSAPAGTLPPIVPQVR